MLGIGVTGVRPHKLCGLYRWPDILQTGCGTLAHATSWEVDRAHWVAAAITRFWSTVSSATWATFLALSTNMAAALATALARFIRMS